jgi:hypothetical protein
MQVIEQMPTVEQTVPVPLLCPTKKKCFPTKEAAEEFSKRVAETYPNQPKQHVYACEDCPSWHLTAMPPSAYAMVRSRSYFPSVPESPTKGRGHFPGTGKYEQRKPEIAELFKQGLKCSEISRKTGIPYCTVYNACIDLGLHQPKTKRHISEGNRHSQSTAAATSSIEDLSSQEQALQAQLCEIQAKKQKLIDAKKLMIGPYNGSGVLLQKEGNTLVLSSEDAKDLIARLAEYLAASQETGEMAA